MILFARHGKAHAQEVRGVVEIILRVNEGLADVVLVGHGGDRRHLGNHAQRRDHALVRIGDVRRVVVEGRKGADRAAHDGHRVGVAAIAGEEAAHLLMHHGVARDAVVEIDLLRLGRQFAVQQEVADFQEVAVFGELVDRVATVQQHAGIAIDIGDLAFARGRRGEAGIVGEGARLLVERTDVDDLGADRPRPYRQFDRLAVECYDCAFIRHGILRLQYFRHLAGAQFKLVNLLLDLHRTAKFDERQIVHCGTAGAAAQYLHVCVACPPPTCPIPATFAIPCPRSA